MRGLVPDSLVTVVQAQWFGSDALELTYKSPTGEVANERTVWVLRSPPRRRRCDPRGCCGNVSRCCR